MNCKEQILPCILTLLIIGFSSCEKKVDILTTNQKTNHEETVKYNTKIGDNQFVLLIDEELSQKEILDLVNKFFLSGHYFSLTENKFSASNSFIYNEIENRFENYDDDFIKSGLLKAYQSIDSNNHLVITINSNDNHTKKIVVIIQDIIGGVTMVIGRF